MIAVCLLASAILGCTSETGSIASTEIGFSRIDAVMEKGAIDCATQIDIPGFGFVDPDGDTRGFDVDLCRAVAAAIFGDPQAVEIHHVHYVARGPLLQAAEVDMLSRTTTWTTTREAQWGDFTVIMFYDGQGFMAPKSLGVNSALELDGATVCVAEGTTTKLNLADYFRQNNLQLETLSFDETSTTYEAYEDAMPPPSTSPSWPPYAAVSPTPTPTLFCPKPSPRNRWRPWRHGAMPSGPPW